MEGVAEGPRRRGLDVRDAHAVVVIEDTTTGERLRFRHEFRQPTEAEWVAYLRADGQLAVVGDRVVRAPAQQVPELGLWEACILRVGAPEGDPLGADYLWDGRPIMEVMPGTGEDRPWRKVVPAIHKWQAVQRLLEVRRAVVENPLGG